MSIGMYVYKGYSCMSTTAPHLHKKAGYSVPGPQSSYQWTKRCHTYSGGGDIGVCTTQIAD